MSAHFAVKRSTIFVIQLIFSISVATLCTPGARAAAFPFETFLTSIEGRYLLTQAPGTEELLYKLAGVESTANASREDLIRLARTRLLLPEFAGERTAVEERFKEIQERFSKTQAGERTHASDTELTRDEKLWLNQAANRLVVNPEWRPSTESTQTIDFFSTSPAETFEGNSARFIKQAPDPALADDGSSTPAAERPRAQARIKKYFSDMKSCLAEKPPAEMFKINYKYILTQLVTDEVMTAGGAVIAAGGIDNVDLKTLPNDLAYEAFASLGDSLIATAPGVKYSVRWYRMQGLGVLQSGADAVLYTFTESKRTAPGNVSTGARFAYNTGWNAAYSGFSIGLYDLIAGLECLDTSTAVVIGAQLGAGLVSNVAYFGIKNVVLGKNRD